MIKFGYTILYVPNVRESIDFYKEAFGFEEKFVTPENDYGELVSGETTLAFCSIELGQSNMPDEVRVVTANKQVSNFVLGFVSDNVEKSHDNAISAGAESVMAVKEKPWGQTVAYVRDNNGFIVEICSPVSV